MVHHWHYNQPLIRGHECQIIIRESKKLFTDTPLSLSSGPTADAAVKEDSSKRAQRVVITTGDMEGETSWGPCFKFLLPDLPLKPKPKKKYQSINYFVPEPNLGVWHYTCFIAIHKHLNF